jgi:hypothetical protein
MELVVISAIVGVLLAAGSSLLRHVNGGMRMGLGRLTLQQEARQIVRRLAMECRGFSGTVTISSQAGAPPFSWIRFNTRTGLKSIYQSGNSLLMDFGGRIVPLTTVLRQITFVQRNSSVSNVFPSVEVVIYLQAPGPDGRPVLHRSETTLIGVN